MSCGPTSGLQIPLAANEQTSTISKKMCNMVTSLQTSLSRRC